MRAPTADPLSGYLAECRALVLGEIEALVPRGRGGALLYELILDYPLRAAKALRPALCIAACRGLGGRLADVVRSAAVLELYHNAFLIHDDIEDGSPLRRGQPTLHRRHGIPVAVNVGDAMLALALEPLLDNARLIGLGRALRVLELVARMARETVEGQALELDWSHGDGARRALAVRDYCNIVFKKSAWYTFVAPLLVGAVIAGADAATRTHLGRFAALLGVAFQIHDDVLSLTADVDTAGKQRDDDLWEGKPTLMLLYALAAATPAEREHAQGLLARPRPERSAADVAWLRALIEERGAIDYARRVALDYARRAERLWARAAASWAPSPHRDFIAALPRYVIGRDR